MEARPEAQRVTGLVVQDGNVYEKGLKQFWDPIKAYWADHSDAHRKALNVLVSASDSNC
jgi:hypothetical protein